MQISSIENNPVQTQAEVVLVGVYADEPCTGAAADVDKASGGLISRLLESKEITGEKYQCVTLYALEGVAARQVLVVGLGKRDQFDCGEAFRTASAASKHLADKQRGPVAFFLDVDWSADLVESAVAGAVVGCQGQDLYRKEKKRHPLAEVLWAGTSVIESGQILGESVNLTRRLINEPAQVIYPESFAQRATEVAKECGLDAEVWDETRLAKERCGALLAVAKGSAREPRMVILRYQGNPNLQQYPLALVGKGVTFDSGGLSIKTSEGMLDMKCDMSGAATVLGAMQAIARLKLPVNIVGLMGLTENMTGAEAYKLGDVLTARNGRTIEVHNTDAEGRLVLADVLSVAVDLGASKIIDLATLTGSCVVALGLDVAGVMTNNQTWCDEVLAAADKAGEPAWQLPMFEMFDEQIKSEVADIKNVGEGRWGGAITAAKFLEQFVDKTPWTHIDIAGPAFREKEKPWLDAGATGRFVRTLVQVARSL